MPPAPQAQPRPASEGRPDLSRFDWTQYPGHGPGAELLGTPRTALDLGCGDGAEAAYLARHHGVQVTGVDHSSAQIQRARRSRTGPGLTFVEAEACAFLAATDTVWDAVYSCWGAIWFTDPERLLPLIAPRLAPGGVLVFAHAEALEGYYGPQGIYAYGLRGPRRLEVRWAYTPDTWADLLKHHGFTDIDTRLEAPDPQNVRTLLVRARSVPGGY
ncbi:class I SAM-dependent methyltransferase [Streptomyces daliensis]